MKDKIKCWVVYCEEYPKGMVCEERSDALYSSKELRDNGEEKAYVRVKYFTREELEALSDAG